MLEVPSGAGAGLEIFFMMFFKRLVVLFGCQILGPSSEDYLNFRKLITSEAVAAMAQTGARKKNFQNFLKLGAL